MRTLVLAGSVSEFKRFLQETGKTRRTHLYLYDRSQLCGGGIKEIINYGTWYRRKDIDFELVEAYQHMITRIKKERTHEQCKIGKKSFLQQPGIHTPPRRYDVSEDTSEW